MVLPESGLSTSLLLQFQFLEGPPPGGFSFCYVIGFPSDSCEHRNGRLRNRTGPLKKCVARIGSTASAPGELTMTLAGLRTRRIGREGLPCLGVRVCAIGVDKSGLLVGGGRKSARNSGRAKPPQKTLASVSGFCKSGILTSLLLQFSVSRRPASAGFSFLGHRISFSWCTAGERARIGMAPHRVCPNIFHTASAIQPETVSLFRATLTRESRKPRRTATGVLQRNRPD